MCQVQRKLPYPELQREEGKNIYSCLLEYQSKYWPPDSLSITSPCYTFLNPCWHPGSSHLLSCPKLPKLPKLMGSPHQLLIRLITVISTMLALFVFLCFHPLPLCSALLFPSLYPSSVFLSLFVSPFSFSLTLTLLLLLLIGLVCWPCSVYFFLLWTLPSPSGCSLSHIHSKRHLLNHTVEWSCHRFIQRAGDKQVDRVEHFSSKITFPN